VTAPTTVAEVLDAAADAVAVAWRQGAVWQPGEKPCAVEAIYAAAALTELGVAAMDAIRTHLGVVGIAAWNDVEGRTQAEVVAALREAAAAARAGQ
jgi:hypothetical protein